MRARSLFLAVTLLIPCMVWPAPTAVLVDTSRSVPPAQFEALKGQIGAMLPDLLAKGPVAIYAFNDTPEKVVDFTSDAGALDAGVKKLAQGGRFTLLYDCLFSAEKDLAAKDEPGVILLFTDGRDENSAVTLEDFASRASAAHVAVVTAGMGASDEKTLRRLAVLTGGRYAGPTGSAAGPVTQAWRETVVALPPPPPPPKPVPVAEPPKPAVPPPPPAVGRSGLLLLIGLLVLGFAVIVGVLFLLLKRTKPPEERVCEQCGRTLNLWENDCPHCLAQKLAITKPGTESTTPAAVAIPEIEPALLQKGPSSESLEHTMVLDEVPVLVLHRGNNPPRMFQLPNDQVVSVGRDKVNTLSVADQTLSAQHFRIVPKEGRFYLVDLQSTNGTLLDGMRISLAELKGGAVIHAGQCDFTFRLDQKKLN